MTIAVTRQEVLELRRLARSSSQRHENKQVVVEGRRAIEGALRTQAKCLLLLATQNYHHDKVSPSDVRIVSQEIIDKIATTQSSQDQLGVFQMRTSTREVLHTEPVISMPIMFLDHICDPGNMGTIIRSCVAFEFGAVIILNGCDPFNPKVVRSSAGSIFGINIFQIDDYEVNSLLSDREIYIAEGNAINELHSIEFPENAVFVVGNEANGIMSKKLFNKANTFAINMAELCESLNVAMASTLIAYQSARQRKERQLR